MSGTRIAITSGDTAGNSRRAATHYGRRGIEDKFGSGHAIKQGEEIAEFNFGFDDLPVFDLDALALRLPDNAQMVKSELIVLEAFVGGTNLKVGTVQADDGTVIDADGLHAVILTAALTADSIHVGGGAQVGALVTPQSQVEVVTTGTYTAGRAQLKVTYEPRLLRLDPSNSN